jgi:hypothetical protein
MVVGSFFGSDCDTLRIHLDIAPTPSRNYHSAGHEKGHDWNQNLKTKTLSFFFDENKGFKLIRPFSVFGFFFLIQFLF